MEVRERIVVGAKELFFQQGIKSTTMDEIARALSVSKKTLYQHFGDKDGLVDAVAKQVMETDKKLLSEIMDASSNAVEQILKINICFRSLHRQLNPVLLSDLQKFYAAAFATYRQFKEEFMLGMLRRNIRQGIQEGYYRADLDAEALARFRLATFDLVMQKEVFPTKLFDNYAQLHFQLLEHFIHGLFTREGFDYYYQLKDQYENDNDLFQSIVNQLQNDT